MMFDDGRYSVSLLVRGTPSVRKKDVMVNSNGVFRSYSFIRFFTYNGTSYVDDEIRRLRGNEMCLRALFTGTTMSRFTFPTGNSFRAELVLEKVGDRYAFLPARPRSVSDFYRHSYSH